MNCLDGLIQVEGSALSIYIVYILNSSLKAEYWMRSLSRHILPGTEAAETICSQPEEPKRMAQYQKHAITFEGIL